MTHAGLGSRDAGLGDGGAYTLNGFLLSGRLHPSIMALSFMSAPLILGGSATLGYGLVRGDSGARPAGIFILAVLPLMILIVILRGLAERVIGVLYSLALSGGLGWLAVSVRHDNEVTAVSVGVVAVGAVTLFVSMLVHPSANSPGCLLHPAWPLVHVGESLAHVMLGFGLTAILTSLNLEGVATTGGLLFSLGLLTAGVFCWGEAFHFPLLASLGKPGARSTPYWR